MAIIISQWLCSNRHCAIALCWDDNEKTYDEAVEQGEKVFDVSAGMYNRKCGICDGPLHVEHGKSIFKTIEEAQAAAPILELGQMIARLEIEELKERNKN